MTRPPFRDTHVTLAHGGGGRAMHDFIAAVFTSAFDPPGHEDQARLFHPALAEPGARLAFTTDSFVVTPLEFPGGDIGKIAVCGTINDLAVGGANPLWPSAAFIIEEGCEIALLHRIVASMGTEACLAGVRIVTGDTKVVGRGAADRVFITTTGIGVIPRGPIWPPPTATPAMWRWSSGSRATTARPSCPPSLPQPPAPPPPVLASKSTKPPSPSAPKYAASAKSSASPPLPRCNRPRQAQVPVSSAAPWGSTPALSPCAPS